MSIVQQLYRQKQKSPSFRCCGILALARAAYSCTLLMLAPQTAYFIRSTLNVNTLRQFPVFAVCVSTLLNLTFILSSPPIFNLIYPSITVCLPHTFSLL